MKNQAQHKLRGCSRYSQVTPGAQLLLQELTSWNVAIGEDDVD